MYVRTLAAISVPRLCELAAACGDLDRDELQQGFSGLVDCIRCSLAVLGHVDFGDHGRFSSAKGFRRCGITLRMCWSFRFFLCDVHAQGDR